MNKVEINISKNGVVFLNGMGDFDKIMQKIDLAGWFWATVCAVYIGSIVWGLVATWTKPCFNVLERIVMTLLMLG